MRGEGGVRACGASHTLFEVIRQFGSWVLAPEWCAVALLAAYYRSALAIRKEFSE
jgi:hypothetical protein